MKNLKNLGQPLSKTEQKNIIGGDKLPVECRKDADCGDLGCCIVNKCVTGAWHVTCAVDID